MQFGAFFMFLFRFIFLEFPLSSAKVAGVTGSDWYRILGQEISYQNFKRLTDSVEKTNGWDIL